MMRKPRYCRFEALESRRMMAVLPEAQLFVYLLNEARHDPPAYQASSGVNVDLSNVPPSQPLAVNSALMNSAQFKATEMATNDYFQHQSPVTGLHPNALVRQFGYNLPSQWSDNDNSVESNGVGTSRTTADENLRRQITSNAHRGGLLGIGGFGLLEEIGMGYARNPGTVRQNWWVAHVSTTLQNRTFLTGVVYNDANSNGRYDLGEGAAGQSVNVGALNTLTNAAGGWSIEVADNQEYTVVVNSGTRAMSARASVGKDNRHLEFRLDSATTRMDFGSWLPSLDLTPPTARLSAPDVLARHQATTNIQVIYQDDVRLDGDSIVTGNIQVLGPQGGAVVPALVSKTEQSGEWVATYVVAAPAGVWTIQDNGVYSVRMLANQIKDSSGNALGERELGTFQVSVSDKFLREDTNDDGLVTPVDVLQIINHLNSAQQSEHGFPPQMDVNRDGLVTPLDVLLVVNFLNGQPSAGEGESRPAFDRAVSREPVELATLQFHITKRRQLTDPVDSWERSEK